MSRQIDAAVWYGLLARFTREEHAKLVELDQSRYLKRCDFVQHLRDRDALLNSVTQGELASDAFTHTCLRAARQMRSEMGWLMPSVARPERGFVSAGTGRSAFCDSVHGEYEAR